jgi:ribosome biogenesis GTPase
LGKKSRQSRIDEAQAAAALEEAAIATLAAEAAEATAAKKGFIEGLIVEGSRGMYRVETEIGPLLCSIRGRLRKQFTYAKSGQTSARHSVKSVKVHGHDPVSIGDRVRVLPSGGGEGTIEEIVARVGGSFSRTDPDKGRGRLTAIAGLDQIVATFAAQEPTPHLRVLDRLLVLAEAQDLAASICIGKIDLGIEPWLAARLAVYRGLGYPVYLVSARTGEGVEAFGASLAGRTSALLGPSGVGKSSLLNAMQPGLGQKVSAIGTTTHKGRHTTTGTRLFPLEGAEGGYLADTAGFRSLALGRDTLDNLDWCFREFRPFLGECAHNDCTHLHEPNCAVRAALAAGKIDAERYDSFRRLSNAAAETFDLDTEE